MTARRWRAGLAVVLAVGVTAAVGVVGVGVGAAAAADTTPPTEPGPVTVTRVTATSATLTWPRSADNVGVEGYRIHRTLPGVPVGALDLISTTDNVVTFTASHLFSGRAYTFGVQAIDAANNLSVIRTVRVTTAPVSDRVAPSAPATSSVAVKAFSSSRVDVVWANSASTDVAAYQVARNGVLVATLDLPRANRWSDNGLGPSTRYTYAVRAVDSANNFSAFTAAKSIVTPRAGTRLIARGPLISDVTSTSARISWWTNVPTPSQIVWGTTSAAGHVGNAPAPVQYHAFTVPGLNAASVITYTVGDGAGLKSAPHAFRTAAAPGTTFSFAALGDYGGNSTGVTQNAANIVASGTSFLQTTGDNIYASRGLSDPNFTTTYSDVDQRFYKPFGQVVATRSFFPANGNQEYYGNGFFWNNFPTPSGNHSWYSYSWGNAHILVMDGEQPFTAGTPQYLFARNDLAAHQGDRWRIVVMHHPPYSSTSANSSSVPVRTALVPLFQAYRVKLVLSGNSHNYERSKPLLNGVPTAGGITYVVNGAGGNGFNAFTLPAPAWTAFREATYYEYLKVTVSPTRLVVQAIRADTRAVVDATTIL